MRPLISARACAGSSLVGFCLLTSTGHCLRNTMIPHFGPMILPKTVTRARPERLLCVQGAIFGWALA